MEGLIDKAQADMRGRDQSVDAYERHMLGTAVQLLTRHRDVLTRRFPDELLQHITQSVRSVGAAGGSTGLSFDELELMDDSQVQENVELARMQQAVLLSAEGEIAELDARLSSAQGLASVRSDSNPFRPHAFGQALRNVLEETQVPADVRLRWMHYVGSALGQQLKALYADLNQLLKDKGIAMAAYTVTQTADARTGAANGQRPTADANQQGGGSGSLEGNTSGVAASVKTSLTMDRLGREVVHLMVGNLVQDERLLAPMRAAIARLEPALMQLAVSDPRFFSHKTHPARVLLDRMTQRSLAFASASETGFLAMMEPVVQCVSLLLDSEIKDHAPFEAALGVLEQTWAEQEAAQSAKRSQAVQALLIAEQRTLLAHKIGQELGRRPDVAGAPGFIKEFLAGPWAQVMAQSQLQQGNPGGSGLGSAVHVDDLVWSVLPDQVRRNRPRLMRVIPTLLPRLRAGLHSIDYPPDEAAHFFAELMRVHQEVIKPAAPAAPAVSAPSPVVPLSASQRLSAQLDSAARAELWLAPREAHDSGFMDLPTQPMQYDTQPMPLMASESGGPDFSPSSSASLALQPGNWVEFIAKGEWVRAQLTWASPQGSLFMFVGSTGQPYTMSLKTLERLRDTSALRMVASQDVVSGALDAVARAALRNSVDVSL